MIYLKNKTFFLLLFFLSLINCDGKKLIKQKCTFDQAISTINNLPEVRKQSEYIDSLSQHKKRLSFMTDTLKINKREYYSVKTGVNGQFHWETYTIFYIEKDNCNHILVDEVISGEVITLEKWRILNKKNYKMQTISNSANPVNFEDLFNEGSHINFTPQDLNKNAPEIQNFRSKLLSFESSYPESHDFDINSLLLLINNETFIHNERFIDSSWLKYFVNKYSFNRSVKDSLINTAIEQEDFSAVKILSKNYIFSQKQLTNAEIKKKYKDSLHGKLDVQEYYDPVFSKIDEILLFIKNSCLENHIEDPDGYTNLRKEKNTVSDVLQKIKSGEYIDVLDNTGDWFLVKTKEGKKGYVHKSRIKN